MLLDGPRADRWQRLFLRHFDQYLIGAKAPDKKFRDFRNHVLHVEDDFWGGAIKASLKWYDKALGHLRKQEWGKAVYAAGVLSHYFTDPLMPFHTGQSEEETQIHRAAEWSITKSYDALKARLLKGLGGYPEFPVPDIEDWLGEMLMEGALTANASYQLMIDHFDFAASVKNPPAGLDDTLRDALAEQLGLTAVGWSQVLGELLEEADVMPPDKRVTIAGYLATLTIPIAWVTGKLADFREKRAVRAMYQELQKSGRVDKTMPADERAVRKLYATEVLGVSEKELAEEPLGEIGSYHGEGPNEELERKPRQSPDQFKLKYFLQTDSDVVDSPSVGPKTAKRLRKVGVCTVAQLISADADELAGQLKAKHITGELIRAWQSQAELVTRVPNLCGHDAQLLVGCQYDQPTVIQDADADELLSDVVKFSQSREGKRVLRSTKAPDRDEVELWIEWAHHSRPLRAA